MVYKIIIWTYFVSFVKRNYTWPNIKIDIESKLYYIVCMSAFDHYQTVAEEHFWTLRILRESCLRRRTRVTYSVFLSCSRFLFLGGCKCKFSARCRFASAPRKGPSIHVCVVLSTETLIETTSKRPLKKLFWNHWKIVLTKIYKKLNWEKTIQIQESCPKKLSESQRKRVVWNIAKVTSNDFCGEILQMSLHPH